MFEIIMHENIVKKIEEELRKLYELSNAKLVFLVDKNGQLISSVGETHNVDTTALASLTAGNIAAAGAIAKLLRQKEFSILFHEGEKENIHISLVADRFILVVVFDQRSSLGLVRLRSKKSTQALEGVFSEIESKVEVGEKEITGFAPFADITDEDIEKLFS